MSNKSNDTNEDDVSYNPTDSSDYKSTAIGEDGRGYTIVDDHFVPDGTEWRQTAVGFGDQYWYRIDNEEGTPAEGF